MPSLETAPGPAGKILLEQIRTIRAPRDRVYEAWTQPEILKWWFGPAQMRCPNAELDVREGGAYRIDMQVNPDAPPADNPPAHREATATGTYTKVVPNELLQFTWDPSWNPGELTLVTILFEEVRGGATLVTIRHERFTSEASRDGHNAGWAGCLEKLAVKLETA